MKEIFEENDFEKNIEKLLFQLKDKKDRSAIQNRCLPYNGRKANSF